MRIIIKYSLRILLLEKRKKPSNIEDKRKIINFFIPFCEQPTISVKSLTC